MGYTRRKNNLRKSKKNKRKRRGGILRNVRDDVKDMMKGMMGGNSEISTGVTGLNNPIPKILGLQKS